MTKFLIDTDIIIWFLRGKKEIVELTKEFQKSSPPACSPISIIEVQFGVKRGEEEITSNFLNSLTIIPIDRTIADKSGELLREYKRKGIALGINDTIIGATCILNDLILVTYNLKHYPFKELKIYSI
ncbi:type II toxin-antitoxin system VapC family toxin [Patescibacteria group bacterium]|nr:type II toxin-antitoxin system VapC family toxin [Patescibacteria group bacterium]MBU4481338.1 type II toxin-antitoxin system VapC family toxin [Patescibacteria group bacterium]